MIRPDNNKTVLSIFSSDSDSDMEILSQLSDWDSDNEDEAMQRASTRKIRRISYMHTLNDADFTFRFRLSKPGVNSLLLEIMPFVRVTSTRNHGVPALHQLLVTLRFYALGTMLASVADFVGVSKSTAGRIVRNISYAIAKLYDKRVFIGEGTEQFYEIAAFPRVLAVLDCTHIRLQAPCRGIGEEYRNPYGNFSINVQAACDANLRFVNMVARWPGSKSDAIIFDKSNLKVRCDSGQFGDRWLLADNAYPCRRYLLTPVSKTVTEAEQRYNEAHSKTRNTIKRTFEIWKHRFPVVALAFRLAIPVVESVIIATAVLHNISREYNLEEIASEVELPTAEENSDDHNFQNESIQDFRERDELIKKYY